MEISKGKLRVAAVEKHLQSLKASGQLQIRPVPYFKPKIRTKRHNPYQDGVRKYELNGRGVYRRDWDQWYHPDSESTPQAKAQRKRVRPNRRKCANQAPTTVEEVLVHGTRSDSPDSLPFVSDSDTSVDVTGELRQTDDDYAEITIIDNIVENFGEPLNLFRIVEANDGKDVDFLRGVDDAETSHPVQIAATDIYYSDIDSGFAQEMTA